MSHRFVFEVRSGTLNKGTCPLTRSNKPWKLVYQLRSEPFNMYELSGDAKFRPLVERLFEKGGWNSRDSPNSAGAPAGDYYILGTVDLRKGESFVGERDEFQGLQLEAQVVATAAGVSEEFRVPWSQRCVFTTPPGGEDRRGAKLDKFIPCEYLSSPSDVYGTAGIFRTPFPLRPLRYIVNPSLAGLEAAARRNAENPFSATFGQAVVRPAPLIPPFTPPGPNGQGPHRNGRWFFPLFVRQTIDFIGPSGRTDEHSHSTAQSWMHSGQQAAVGSIVRNTTPTWSQVAPSLTEVGFLAMVNEIRATLQAKIAERLAASRAKTGVVGREPAAAADGPADAADGPADAADGPHL
jgi:hypothetical protein